MWMRSLSLSAIMIQFWLSVVISRGVNALSMLEECPEYLKRKLRAAEVTLTALTMWPATHMSKFLFSQNKHAKEKEAALRHPTE